MVGNFYIDKEYGPVWNYEIVGDQLIPAIPRPTDEPMGIRSPVPARVARRSPLAALSELILAKTERIWSSRICHSCNGASDVPN
jgi:hypothetical protein